MRSDVDCSRPEVFARRHRSEARALRSAQVLKWEAQKLSGNSDCTVHLRRCPSWFGRVLALCFCMHFFASPPHAMVAWKANVSHGLLLMLLTVCPSG